MPTVLVANPTSDVYGSDLQVLESVAGLRERGWEVVVTSPRAGPLDDRLRAAGAAVLHLPVPVLHRSDASLAGVAGLLRTGMAALPKMRGVVQHVAPSVVYVNTITVPWWLLAARSMGVSALCHVHEAEARDHRRVQQALAAPLFLADVAVVNSRTTQEALCAVAPRLQPRTRLVHNGVAGPPVPPRPPHRTTPGFRIVVVGRLSARKAPDVALESTALLRSRGHDVRIEVCGTAVPGQEAFERRLRQRADQPDLRGAVEFAGYSSPIWPSLERADALVAPSLGESFGNAVVEAQLACRPVVATAVQGHLETVLDGVSGLLVPTEDPESMARATQRLMEDRALADSLAVAGMERARALFGTTAYREAIGSVVEGLAPAPGRRTARRRSAHASA